MSSEDDVHLLPEENGHHNNEDEMEVIEGTTEFQMKVVKVKPIHDKRLYGEIRFAFHGNQQYEAGDYVVIRPKNNPEDVENLCQMYKLNEKQLELPYHLPFSTIEEPQFLSSNHTSRFGRFSSNIFLKDIIYEELDLSGPPTFAFMKDPIVREALPHEMLDQTTDMTAYTKWVRETKPSLLTVLHSLLAPLSLDFLVHNAHLIQPRCYLVASARRAAVSIYYERSYIEHASMPVPGGEDQSDSNQDSELSLKPARYGLCFSYFQRLKEGDVVNAVLCKGAGLILPEDRSKRILIIAGGIGFGASRAFMDQKRRRQLTGKQTILVEIPSEPKNSFQAITTTFRQYATEDRNITVTPLPLGKDGVFGSHMAQMLRKGQWPQLLPRLRAETDCQVYIVGSEEFCDNVRKPIGEIMKLSDQQLTKAAWLFEERITTALHPVHLHMTSKVEN